MELLDIERALIKRYRAKLYRPFVKALNEYKLIEPKDKIAVCISGGKDSLVLAKLFQELERHGNLDISVKYIVMNPGFVDDNLEKLKANCKKLNIPIIIKDSNIFSVSEKLGKGKPCYLCARMRRGFLYQFAKEQDCNKIALAHHFNDVIETTLLNVLYAGNYKTMVPKLKSKNFTGMELIRPMVFIRENDIINYMNYCKIEAMKCGCKMAAGKISSKRKEVRQLIADVKKSFDNVDVNIYRSSENVNLNCVLGWKQGNKNYKFIDEYDKEIK